MGAYRGKVTAVANKKRSHINFVHAKKKAAKKQLARPWKIFIGSGLVVASIGVVYVGVLMAGFFGLKFHLTDVPGTVDQNSQAYETLAKSLFNVPLEQLHLPSVDTAADSAIKLAAAQDACHLKVVRAKYPQNAERISAAQAAGATHQVLAKMIFAVQLRDNDSVFLSALTRCTTDTTATPPATLVAQTRNVFPWANTEEWSVAKEAFKKDASKLATASTVTSVEARMIVAAGFVEQMRLYFTEREFYEKFFRPLKILGNATQFAWGVMAIKESAAIDVENHLRDKKSVFYLGASSERALDFSSGSDVAKERLARLTDEKNHLFSYLYGGFELAQYRAQWERAGFPIGDRPEILATLYNIGFGKSKPNDHPQVGGSTIRIADTDYTFGALAFEYYYSGEMIDLFPYTVPSS